MCLRSERVYHRRLGASQLVSVSEAGVHVRPFRSCAWTVVFIKTLDTHAGQRIAGTERREDISTRMAFVFRVHCAHSFPPPAPPSCFALRVPRRLCALPSDPSRPKACFLANPPAEEKGT